jgi:hypothetical protein
MGLERIYSLFLFVIIITGAGSCQSGLIAPTEEQTPRPAFRAGSPASLLSPSTPTRLTATSAPGAVGTSIRSANTSTPITVHFELDKAPRVNESVSLTVTLNSARDAPQTTAKVEIPDSASLISGTLEFNGDLKQEEPVQFRATIKFGAEGDWVVRAIARHFISEDEIWGDSAYLYLHVGKDAGHFGFDSPMLPPSGSDGASPPPAVTPGG